MAEHKTGALAKMAARLSCVMLGQDEKIGAAMANFALKTSIAFQIQDVRRVVKQGYLEPSRER